MKNSTTVSTPVGEILKKLNKEHNVTSIHICNCGAITFVLEDGNDYSVKAENADKFFTAVSREEFEVLANTMDTQYCNCNHCVNHWGLDICECGSGEETEDCKKENGCAGRPAQIIGGARPDVFKFFKNHG